MDKKKLRRYLLIAGGLIVLLLVVLPFIVNANSFRPLIEKKLSAALNRKVQVGELSLSLFSGSLVASDLSIADDPKFSNTPFLTAESLRVGVEMMPLITAKTLNVTGLTIEKPAVNLVKNLQGKWNFSTLGGSASAPQKQETADASDASGLQIARLQLKEGRATVTSPASKSVYESVDLEATDLSANAQFPAKLSANLPGGGTFVLDGKVGPFHPTDSTLTPLDAKVNIKALDLAKTGFVDQSTGISGIVDLANTLVSRNGTAHAEGNASLAKLQLVKSGAPSSIPISVDYAVDYNLTNRTGTLNRGVVTIGKAAIKLSGTFEDRNDAMALSLKVDGQAIPVSELTAALPAFGVVLPKGSLFKTGTASANLLVQGPSSATVITGNVGLFNAQLAGFDLSSKMSAITALTGGHGSTDTTIQKFTSNVRIAPDGLQAKSIDGVVPAIGQVTGSGTVSPSGALNFKMVAALSSSGIAGSIPGMQRVSSSGATRVPFAIQGTSSDPKFIPDVGGAAASVATDILKTQAAGALQKSSVSSALDGLLGTKPKKK